MYKLKSILFKGCFFYVLQMNLVFILYAWYY